MNNLHYVLLILVSWMFSPFSSAESSDTDFHLERVKSVNGEEENLIVKGPFFIHHGLCMRDVTTLTLIDNRVHVTKPNQLFFLLERGESCLDKYDGVEVIYSGDVGLISADKYMSALDYLDRWCNKNKHELCIGYSVKEFYLGKGNKVRFVVLDSKNKSYSIVYSSEQNPFVGELLN